MVPEVSTNQEIFNATKHQLLENIWSPHNARGFLFKIKFYTWALVNRLILPYKSSRAHPFLPGIEVYKAIQYA